MREFIFKLLMLYMCISRGGAKLHAQVVFRFLPAINGQRINGLFTAQLLNASSNTYTGKVKIIVRDPVNKTVLVAVTPIIMVKPGATDLNSVAARSVIQFGNSNIARLLGQTGRFPENEYEYCYEFTGSDKAAAEQMFENCFNYSIEPTLPLSLVYPDYGDEICETRPPLIWQPAMPVNNELRYHVVLSENKNGQQMAEALIKNTPLIQADNLMGYVLPFPPLAPSLEENKEYTWQVLAYLGNKRLTQSEFSRFSVKCHDKKVDSLRESYRELSSSLNGNFYMAVSILRFAVVNSYTRQQMNYTITDLSDPAKKISKMPNVELMPGLNKIDLDITAIRGVEQDNMYLLEIKNAGTQPLYLRFIYKGNEK